MWRRNVPRASIVEHQLLSLLTVHRLFRRKLLLTHDIRFPERIGLLEDQPFALKSYLTADIVSVLADYPVYRWIVQEGTSSQRQPNLETAHANIRECVDLVESYTSSGPERDAMLGRWLGSLADSVGPRLLRRPAESWSKWLNDVRRLVEERFPARLDALATPIQRIRLAALRAGDLDALVALAQLRAGALSPGPDAWLRLARRRPRRPGDGDTGGSERSADGVRAGRRPVDPPLAGVRGPLRAGRPRGHHRCGSGSSRRAEGAAPQQPGRVVHPRRVQRTVGGAATAGWRWWSSARHRSTHRRPLSAHLWSAASGTSCSGCVRWATAWVRAL